MTPNVGDRVWRTEDGKVAFDGYVSSTAHSSIGDIVWAVPKTALPATLLAGGRPDYVDNERQTPISTLSLMLSLDGWSWVPYERKDHPALPESTDAQRKQRDRLNILSYAREHGWSPTSSAAHQMNGTAVLRRAGRFLLEVRDDGRWSVASITDRADGGYFIDRTAFADAPGGTALSVMDAMIAADKWLESR